MALLLTTLPAAAAVIQGVVLDQRTGYPAARASVTVRDWSSGRPGVAATVLTDRGGRFTVTALPAGAYVVTATRLAYGVTQYGQRRKNAPGTLVALDKDASTLLELRLQRLAAFSGTVCDENFLGLPDHPVHVYTARPPVRRVASGTSDDRGVFRIGKLEPGRYLVRSGSRDLEDGQATLPTFAPQALAANEGRTVAVTLDDEALEVNVQPFFGRLTSLEVTVAIPGGQAKVIVASDSGRREATVGAFASFVFDRLAPGWSRSAALWCRKTRATPRSTLCMSAARSSVTRRGLPGAPISK